jgi:hypothetical protein
MHVRGVVPALVLAGVCVIAVAGGAVAGPAPRGYVVVTTPEMTAPAGQQTRGGVACPPGRVPLGGGVFISTSSTLASVNDSFPVDTGWIADVNNANGSATTFQVSVICARQPNRYVLVQSSSQVVTPGQQGDAFAACPKGTRPFSGGEVTDSTSPAVTVNTSVVQSHRWVAFENNASSGDVRVSAFAICGRVKGYLVVGSRGVTVPPQMQVPDQARCPTGSVAIGGGSIGSVHNLGVSVNSSFVDGNDWDSEVNNGTDAPAEESTTVICAGA